MYEIGRIRFRPFLKEDLGMMMRWENSHEVTLFARGKPLVFKSPEEIQNEYDDYLKDDKKQRLIVELIEDDKDIGIATYKDRSGFVREASVGTYIGEELYWNKGLGKEITLGLCEMLFFQLNYDRLSAWSSSINERAHKVLKSFGFKLSGRARKSGYLMGRRIDWCMFDLLREEYMPKREKYLDHYLTEEQLDTYYEKHCTLHSFHR